MVSSAPELARLTLNVGKRLFDRLGDRTIELERTGIIESPHATHLSFTVRACRPVFWLKTRFPGRRRSNRWAERRWLRSIELLGTQVLPMVRHALA